MVGVGAELTAARPAAAAAAAAPPLIGPQVIFRQTFSYNRYMEGRVQVALMSGAWADAAALAASFDSGAAACAPACAAAAAAFRADLAHALSLAHALCLAALRADPDLANLRAHDSAAPPPYDSRVTPGFRPSLISYFVVYRRLAQRRAHCAAAKLPVLGGVSAAERRRLGGGLAADARRHTAVRGGGGLARGLAALWTSEGGRHYEAAARRPTAAYAAALERVRLRMVEGAFDMPAPIAAAFWQAASRGLEAFEHARYLVDTPFPFPWAQLIVATLLVFQLVVPISVVASYSSRPLGCVMAMATTWILCALRAAFMMFSYSRTRGADAPRPRAAPAQVGAQRDRARHRGPGESQLLPRPVEKRKIQLQNKPNQPANQPASQPTSQPTS